MKNTYNTISNTPAVDSFRDQEADPDSIPQLWGPDELEIAANEVSPKVDEPFYTSEENPSVEVSRKMREHMRFNLVENYRTFVTVCLVHRYSCVFAERFGCTFFNSDMLHSACIETPELNKMPQAISRGRIDDAFWMMASCLDLCIPIVEIGEHRYLELGMAMKPLKDRRSRQQTLNEMSQDELEQEIKRPFSYC